MTSTNPGSRVGGFRREVDHHKLGSALLIASRLVLAIRTARWAPTPMSRLALRMTFFHHRTLMRGFQITLEERSPSVGKDHLLEPSSLNFRALLGTARVIGELHFLQL